MRNQRAVSSMRQVSCWLIVASGLVVYAAIVLLFGMVNISPTFPLPWWMAQAVPPILYTTIARLCFRRLSPLRWTVVSLGLWGIHVLLGALTALVLSSLRPLSMDVGMIDAFPAPALPGILWVPLLLVPFRDLIREPVSRTRRRVVANRPSGGAQRNGSPTPLPAAPHGAALAPRPGNSAQPRTAGIASATDRPKTDGSVSRQPSSASRSSSVQQRPAGKSDVSRETTRGGAGSPPRRPDEAPRRDEPEVPLRVSFGRVAGQLPTGAFHISLDQIGASLAEPGHVLIPRGLVLAQLAEGFVRAGWEVVAAQFPQDLWVMTDAEITSRLAEGQLVLPLDELVSQLPTHLFAPRGRTVDVADFATVPAPFQPAPPEGQVATQMEGPWTTLAQDVTAPLASKADAVFDTWARTGDHAADIPERENPPLEDAELDSILIRQTDGVSSLPMNAGHRPLRRGAVEDLAAWPWPAWTDDASEPSVEAASADAIATMQRILAALAPLRTVDVRVHLVKPMTLFTMSPYGLDRGAILGAARILLPLLREGLAPWPADQLTMRGADAVFILTPIGSMRPGGSVLLSIVQPEGAVAAAERLALQAAAAQPGASTEPQHRSAEWQEPDLLDWEPPTRVLQIGASLDALGAVTTAVLRDQEAARDLFLFLPNGSDVRMTGRFATELDRAIRQASESGYTFHMAVLRSGRRRLIFRAECAETGRATIVVAGGVTERPGLACRQVEAAARALCER